MTLVLFAAGNVRAQDYEKVLVPLPLVDTPGAYGSLWRTLVVVSNISETPVDVQGYGECAVPCTPPPIPPGGTVHISTMPRSEVPAAFLFIERGRRDDVSITIRTFDQSRLHLTWGASVPVITRAQSFAGTFGVGDIPVSDAFRSTLRIYDFDATTPAAVRVRVYRVSGLGPPAPVPATPDVLLAELHPSFVVPAQGGGAAGHPAYAAVSLSSLPEVQDVERIRVVIEPLDTTGDYWAFASATHNETQHVTVIPPR